MKRTLSIPLILLILSTGFSLSAQNKRGIQKKKASISLDSLVFQKLTNRLEVGYNNPAQYGSGRSTTYFNGVKIGLTSELALKSNFSLLAGVLYNLVYSDKAQIDPTSVNYLTYGHFINVPVLLIYNLPISNDLKFSVYGGPDLNVGLGQIQQVYSTVSTIPNSYTNLYKSTLNQLDLQIGCGAGVQWKKFQLKGGYDFGLLNINRLSTGNIYQKGWYVSLSVTL